MEQTSPFDNPPYFIFLLRTLVPALLLVAALGSTVGVLGTTFHINHKSLSSADVETTDNPEPSVNASVHSIWESALDYYAWIFQLRKTIPASCKEGGDLSPFQQNYCQRFWNQVINALILALTPLLIPLFILGIGLTQLKAIYHRLRKQYLKNQATFMATVTDPASAPPDFFSWLFGFKPITIELTNHEQITGYVLLSEIFPSAGNKVAAFKAGKWGNKTRYVVLFYAPHISILRG